VPLVTLGVLLCISAFEPLKSLVLLLKQQLLVLPIPKVAFLVLVILGVNPKRNVIDLGRTTALPLLEVLLMSMVAIRVLDTTTVHLLEDVFVHGRPFAKLKVLILLHLPPHLPPVWRVLVTPCARLLISVKDCGKNLVLPLPIPLALCKPLALMSTVMAVLVQQATPSVSPLIRVFVVGRNHVSQEHPLSLLVFVPLVILGALITKHVSDHGKPLA